MEGEKGELERENTLIKALLPPLSPAAQALMSLAADVHDVQGGPGVAQGRVAIARSGEPEAVEDPRFLPPG